MANKTITLFYAWQSDSNPKLNRNFIRRALDDAAGRISSDTSLAVEVVVDADTEGVVGTPAVSETILKKINAADIFVGDVTFVTQTAGGKFIPNPNVMLEYGYALRAHSFEAVMLVMNIAFGGPERLPFDLAHLRFPTRYCAEAGISDGARRKLRSEFSQTLEANLRLMIQRLLQKGSQEVSFVPAEAIRPPAFFFQEEENLVNFGNPGEQEFRFPGERALYLRLFPSFADQPRVGLVQAAEVAKRLVPFPADTTPLSNRNERGAISLVYNSRGITNLAQIYASGELWAVSSALFQHSHQQQFLHAARVEQAFVKTAENFRSVYQNVLLIRHPVILECGAVGLKNFHLALPAGGFGDPNYLGPIYGNDYSRRVTLNSYDPLEWQAALRDFFVELYDLAASERSKVLTESLVTAYELPPL
jgi:hypothetical protein